MTRPTARVLGLLELLQAGGGTRTAGELAAQLGVDERTLRRYVDHLVELDIPVEAVRGRYGGYRLAPGFRMPPLMLTDEEALAVLLGLLTGRRGVAAETATAKVRRVLPAQLARRLEALLETISVTEKGEPETKALLTLAAAARDRTPVAIGYTARDGRASERTIHPYGIVAHAGRWYVSGHDSASGEVRTFRLDRIAATTVLPGTFEPPEAFNPADHLLSGIAGANLRYAVSVLVQSSAEEIRPRLPATVFTIEEAGQDQVRVRLQAERLDWVPAVLAGLDRPFVIEEPAELRDHVHRLAARLAEA